MCACVCVSGGGEVSRSKRKQRRLPTTAVESAAEGGRWAQIAENLEAHGRAPHASRLIES